MSAQQDLEDAIRRMYSDEYRRGWNAAIAAIKGKVADLTPLPDPTPAETSNPVSVEGA